MLRYGTGLAKPPEIFNSPHGLCKLYHKLSVLHSEDTRFQQYTIRVMTYRSPNGPDKKSDILHWVNNGIMCIYIYIYIYMYIRLHIYIYIYMFLYRSININPVGLSA